MFQCLSYECSLNADVMNGCPLTMHSEPDHQSPQFSLAFPLLEGNEIYFYEADLICLPLNSRIWVAISQKKLQPFSFHQNQKYEGSEPQSPSLQLPLYIKVSVCSISKKTKISSFEKSFDQKLNAAFSQHLIDIKKTAHL